VNDLAWADAHLGEERSIGDIFCLTFVKQVDVTEALRRMGGLFDTIAMRTPAEIEDLHTFDDGYPEVAAAMSLGDWTLVVEPNGYQGLHLVGVLSSGTEAVSVLRHDYSSPKVAYAVDGGVVTEFDPTFPGSRWGSDPDRLVPQMLDVGFTVEDNEDDEDFDMFENDTARSLRLVERLTGVLPTLEALTAPMTSVHIERWFSDARKPPASAPVDAVEEVRRLADLLDLADTPGLQDALTATKPVHVTPDSPLGRHVRDWLTESRRASWSLNDHGGRSRMTEERRHRSHDLSRLAAELGAALQSDLKPAE
jgi:hypothetical protein